MSDIFISYSRKDKLWVDMLAGALKAQGYDVWWDPEILPGQDFEEIIRAALDDAKCVVTVWSQESVNSHWVKEESTKALNRRVLVPVLYQSVNLPLPFGRIHTADLVNWVGDTDESRFQQLLRAISIHCNYKSSLLRQSLPSVSVDAKVQRGGSLSELRQAMFTAVSSRELQIILHRLNNEYSSVNSSDVFLLKQDIENAIKRTTQLEGEKSELKFQAKVDNANSSAARNKNIILAIIISSIILLIILLSQRSFNNSKPEKPTATYSDNNFIDNGNGTITDTKTSLMWKKCTEGLSENDCSIGSAKKFTWKQAISSPKSTNFSGYDDWRLPTKNELVSLLYCSNTSNKKPVSESDGCTDKDNYQQPTIDTKFFPGTRKGDWYWSSSSVEGKIDNAWGVFFYYGSTRWLGTDGQYFVQLVRDVK